MGQVKMCIWDVKHGSAIFIKAPNEKIFLIDLGRGDYSENSDDRSPLETIRHHYNIHTIDHLTITHPHKDHIDDILNLDNLGIDIRVLQIPTWLTKDDVMIGISENDKPKFNKYFALKDSHTQSVEGTNNDSSIAENNGGLSIERFYTSDLPKNNLNNHSIMTILQDEGITVVIPGDNEYASLEKLMEREDFRSKIQSCDILIAPHHGRESAYHEEFLTAANPRVTIISDGSVCDTSANAKYSQKSRGWEVWKHNQKTMRYLLTTNSDGEIYIDFERETGKENAFLQIEIKN